jgi:beta-xylosidase
MINRRKFLSASVATAALNLLSGLFSCKQNPQQQTPTQPGYGDVDINDPNTQIPGGIEPLIDVWLRDPVITIGRDGEYILTGTTRITGHINASQWNDGLHAWRSTDLKNWEDLGCVWKLDDGPEWIRNFHVFYPDGGKIVSPEEFYKNPPAEDVPVRRSLWSPRIIFSKKHNTCLAACCMSFNMGIAPENWITPIFGGTFILKSISGKPEGPYEVTSEHPLTYYIDCRIFEDDDETLYFIWQDGNIAKLNDKLDGIYEYHSVWQKNFNPEPVKEGIHIFKHNGLYHLVLSIFSHEIDGKTTYNHVGHGGKSARTYDAVIATSKSIYGPYGERYTSITDGGHGNHFVDKDGNWWAGIFHEDDDHNTSNGLQIKPRLVPMHWKGDKIFPKNE